jgi:methionine aminotransferase
MTPQLTSKLPEVGTTIFTVMSQLAADCDAINLSQGFPGFDPDPDLLHLVDHYLQRGANQYAPMPGVPALRHEIAVKTERLYGRQVDENTEVTVCRSMLSVPCALPAS